MTKPHDLGYYQDGHVSVAYCKRCSAEGEKLLEACPQKVSSEPDISRFTLDEKKLPAK